MHLQSALVTLAFLGLANAAVDVGQYLTKDQEFSDQPWVACAKVTDDDNIHKYSIEHLNASLGKIEFSKFKGKPILIVNVATYCHSTFEYPLYNKLVEKFGDKLALIAFPSNNFDNVSTNRKANNFFHLSNAMSHTARALR